METIIRPRKSQCPMCGERTLKYEYCYKTDGGKYLYEASCDVCETEFSLIVIKDLRDTFEAFRVYHERTASKVKEKEV